MQRYLYEHLNFPGHSGFLDDVSVTHIDKSPNNLTKRGD